METRRSIPHYRQQASFNLIGLVVMLGVKLTANRVISLERQTGKLSDQFPRFFLPAGITLSVWTLIYVAVFAFGCYQFWLAFTKGHETELEAFNSRMKGWFLLNCLANSCRLFAWHYNELLLSLIFMLVLLYSLVMIHRSFRIAHPGAGWREKLFIHFPFGLYFGWASMLTGVYLTVWLASLGLRGTTLMAWGGALMGLATLLTLVMIRRYNNIYFGLAAIWAFYGVVLNREAEGGRVSAPFIAGGTAIIAVLTLALLWQIVRRRRLQG